MAMTISQDVLGFDHAMIRLLDANSVLRAEKWIGFPREAADLPIHLGEGITGQVALLGKSILVEDTTVDSRFIKGVEDCRSELCSPMQYNGATIGVFNVESEQRAYFSDEDRHVLENFATQITAALETARLRDELGRSEKLSMIGSFASSILHDIRNDLHQLKIGADLLEAAPDDQTRVETVARKIRKSAENIQGLVEDSFEFVRTGQSPVTKRRVEVGPFLENFFTSVMVSFPENAILTLETEGEMAVEADQRRLRRMMLNLVTNGLEAMPEGGNICVRAFGEGGFVHIEVADTGKGIEPERLEKIWEPFYTSGKRQGTGLGMAIIKKIADDHGWGISVKSTLGQGTSFRLTAPAL